MKKLHAALIAGLFVTTAFAQAALPASTIGATTSTSISASPDIKVPNAVVAADTKAKAGVEDTKSDASTAVNKMKSHHASVNSKAKANAGDADVDAKAGVSLGK
ncbi:hypothetical protein [Glaciimonas immobilis]|uniref:Uncharacterized protein n=1 Tax=Glaciimonas immobilis TaxID=728004 RepID=A0A840RMV2_9BURK|nr:hypothetical protein [Glaciimonas immobilis]KAF3996816.1 hypothetical protein HAV38_16645 [Glaciimonas immobilis]MBB5199637.1 hypothetical protein [Glaciimonas immobilis]